VFKTDNLEEAKRVLNDCISVLQSSVSKEEGLVKVSIKNNNLEYYNLHIYTK